MTVLHSGSNKLYSENWLDAFGSGGKKKTATKKATPKKKGAANKTAADKKSRAKKSKKG